MFLRGDSFGDSIFLSGLLVFTYSFFLAKGAGFGVSILFDLGGALGRGVILGLCCPLYSTYLIQDFSNFKPSTLPSFKVGLLIYL